MARFASLLCCYAVALSLLLLRDDDDAGLLSDWAGRAAMVGAALLSLVAAKEEVGQAASAGLLCHFSSVANVLDMLSIVGVLLTAWRLLLGHQSAEGVLSSNGGLYELQTRYLGAVTVVLMLPQAMVHLLLLRVLMLYLPTPNDPPTPQTSQFRHPL